MFGRWHPKKLQISAQHEISQIVHGVRVSSLVSGQSCDEVAERCMCDSVALARDNRTLSCDLHFWGASARPADCARETL